MNESELIEELSRKAHVPAATVRAVIDALIDAARRGHVSEDILTGRAANARSPESVDDLIARARSHDLGLEFLLDGYLASVAAEFGTHAFTVEEARLRLRSERRKTDEAG